jgi:hypothetical protein
MPYLPLDGDSSAQASIVALRPMLARRGELPAGEGWAYVGRFRAVVSTEDGLRVRSRRGWDMTGPALRVRRAARRAGRPRAAAGTSASRSVIFDDVARFKQRDDGGAGGVLIVERGANLRAIRQGDRAMEAGADSRSTRRWSRCPDLVRCLHPITPTAESVETRIHARQPKAEDPYVKAGSAGG